MTMDFEVGTVVYAKLRGYPCGWVNKDDLKPFVQNEAEESLEKMKNSKRTNKLLEKSIRDAFDPSSLDEDNSSMDTDDFNHDNESSPNNENDEENSNKSSLSSSTAPKTTATVRNKAQSKGRKITKISSATATTNVRKRKGRQPSETSNDLNNGGKSEANSMDVDENNVKTEKSTNVAQEANDSSEHQAESSAHDHSSPIENQESSTARSNKSLEHEKLEKKLLRLRRRLQRLVLKDEGIEPQDVEKVNEIFEEIEKFPVSVPMLRGTKVVSVMFGLFTSLLRLKRGLARNAIPSFLWTEDGDFDETIFKILYSNNYIGKMFSDLRHYPSNGAFALEKDSCVDN
nr:8959_t:CDS:2 [Entrophospora candida]